MLRPESELTEKQIKLQRARYGTPKLVPEVKTAQKGRLEPIDRETRLQRIEERLDALEKHTHTYEWDPDDEKAAYDTAMTLEHGPY